MTLTNRLNLPHAIVQAVTNDPYTRGASDISVTQLILPPYLRRLRTLHPLQEDVADRIWALTGQIGHAILERYKPENGLSEERLYLEVAGPRQPWTVSGQFDLLVDAVLSDFKFTSVWAAKDGGKIEWEQQLNLLRVLCDRVYADTFDGRYEVNALQIIAIYRDWQKSKAGEDSDYPKSQVDVLPIRLWSKDEATAFLHERVALHQAADPPPCTDEERWKKADAYAVMKPGGKRAMKLFTVQSDAEAWLSQQSDSAKLWIDKRSGEYRRCASYCGVSHACPVWQEALSKAPF